MFIYNCRKIKKKKLKALHMTSKEKLGDVHMIEKTYCYEYCTFCTVCIFHSEDFLTSVVITYLDSSHF
jgi:hypothetical protein